MLYGKTAAALFAKAAELQHEVSLSLCRHGAPKTLDGHVALCKAANIYSACAPWNPTPYGPSLRHGLSAF